MTPDAAVAGAGRLGAVPLSASEPTHNPKAGVRQVPVSAESAHSATAVSGRPELPDWAESWSKAKCECGARCVNVACYCGGHLVCSVSGWAADTCLSHAPDSDGLIDTPNGAHGPDTDLPTSPHEGVQ